LNAVAFAIAMHGGKDRQGASVTDLIEIAYHTLLPVLHWIIHLVPLGELCIVARVGGIEGVGPFEASAGCVRAVRIPLPLQASWCRVRIRLFSWPRPWYVLVGVRYALIMAFSTSSSTATMPVTYACLKDNVKLREQSASLGALVGANFN